MAETGRSLEIIDPEGFQSLCKVLQDTRYVMSQGVDSDRGGCRQTPRPGVGCARLERPPAPGGCPPERGASSASSCCRSNRTAAAMASSEEENRPLRTLAWTNCSRSGGKWMLIKVSHLIQPTRSGYPCRAAQRREQRTLVPRSCLAACSPAARLLPRKRLAGQKLKRLDVARSGTGNHIGGQLGRSA